MGLLDIGKLDRRVTIRSYSTTKNDFGEPIDSWSDLVTVWGRIEWGKTDDESFEQGKETSFDGIDVLIRFRDDIDPKMRLIIEGNTYDIKSINRMESRGRDRYLLIKALKDD